MVAIDGSQFKAVNSRDRSFSRGSIERRIEQVRASIGRRYLSALETSGPSGRRVGGGQVGAAEGQEIPPRCEQMRKYKALEVAVHAAPDNWCC